MSEDNHEAIADRIADRLSGTVAGTPRTGAPAYFQVKGPGYTEQFSTMPEARKAFGKRKRELIKEEARFTLRLSQKAKPKDKWELVDECRIDEEYYS